jgi:secondary thiamine-phosphate synthase enzyme
MQALSESGVHTPGLVVFRDHVILRTERRFQYVDLTELVAERIRRWRIRDGILNVQTHHTTTALFVNENEPLLLQDLEALLERLAPREAGYRHDDHANRLPPVPADERPNGHAHCRALLLRTSETLNVVDSVVQLGRWQRILLLEMDGPQSRRLSLAALGSRESQP